jgi:hypothetical protein
VKGATPTKRTLDELRHRGAIADVVERWIPSVGEGGAFISYGRRKDLFGFIDIVAILDRQIVGIQATSDNSGGHGGARVKKIQQECADAARAWLEAGGLISVWAWRKYAKPVERKLWRPIVTPVTLEDLA